MSERRENHGENQRISMRTDPEVLSSFDLIITTRVRDSRKKRERLRVSSEAGRGCTGVQLF